MNEVPPIVVELVQSGGKPGGLGEVGVPLVAPAMDCWTDSAQPWADHGQRMAIPRGPSEDVLAQLVQG